MQAVRVELHASIQIPDSESGCLNRSAKPADMMGDSIMVYIEEGWWRSSRDGESINETFQSTLQGTLGERPILFKGADP